MKLMQEVVCWKRGDVFCDPVSNVWKTDSMGVHDAFVYRSIPEFTEFKESEV